MQPIKLALTVVLQQAEEFEYVTTPDYRTRKPLEISIKQFFDDTLSLLKEPLSSVVKFTNPYVPEYLRMIGPFM